jgi:P27 family predicted phage terminase small subunit
MKPCLPDELHALRGTQKTRRSRAKEEVVVPLVGGRPRMPKDMPAQAQEKWKELVAILRKRGTLTKGDGPILELACTTYARWRAALLDLDTRGTMIDVEYFANERTYTKTVLNPVAKIAAQLESRLCQLYIQLGVTPTTRLKAKQVAAPPPKEKVNLGPDGRPLVRI